MVLMLPLIPIVSSRKEHDLEVPSSPQVDPLVLLSLELELILKV
jgi:hypothetical protein